MTIAAIWWSSSSFGVGPGLGEVNVVSRLSAPFEASITVKGMDAIDLDSDQFSIRIDGESGANIDYRLERVDADTALIHLYTREAISEPVIQFRVEVSWDRNAVARSYDAFVDPPAYQEYFKRADAPADDRSSAAEPASDTLIPATQLPPIVLGGTSASTAQADDVPTDEVVMEESAGGEGIAEHSEPRREYGPTIDGNSIWRVARAVATDAADLTIYQWMYAIWQANQQAFTGANMHRLKMGEVLAIPLEDEVREISHAEAWRVYSSQLALLQPVDPVAEESVQQAGVAAEPQAQAQSAEPSFVEVTGAPVDKLVQFDDPAADTPAKASLLVESRAESVAATANEDVLIKLPEDSASAMDERVIVSTHQAGMEEAALAKATAEPGSGGSGEVTTMPAAEMTHSATLDTTASQPVMAGEVIVNGIEAVDTKSVTTVDQSARELALMPAADQVADQADAAANAIDEVPVADWYVSLQSRHRFIETMPVIGAAGSLAFVGRALQRVDAFIATSPSWAALAFGAWITLMIVMLRNELVARRRRLRAVAAREPAAAVGVTSAEASAQDTQPEEGGEPADEESTRRRQLPLQPPSESNARAIIAQADSILAGGDAEEAIKLMKLAVDLQPNQPLLVKRLLELYYQTRRDDAFDELMNDLSAVLKNLDTVDLAKLQVIHARLFPGTSFPLAHVLAESSAQEGATAPGTPVDKIALADESDPEAAASNRFDAVEGDIARGAYGVDFVETQVVYTSKGVPLRQQAAEQQGMVGEILDLSVTLKEADVYLAYGLYDNAEDLLLKGMEVDPERADFLAGLLDVYYATRNVVDFVSCAEVMLDMGDQGREYWEKVEIMGYELAPYNKMFAAGKDRSLSAVELGIPKPETADFDFSHIEEGGEEDFAEIEIDSDEEAEALSAELKLDLTTSAYEDTAGRLGQILSLDTSGAPPIPSTAQHFDDDDISIFVLDDDDEVDDDEVDAVAGKGEQIQSLQTSEILAIPETSENSSQDSSTADPEPANDLDDFAEELDQLPSLNTSEILAIPGTSALSDSEDREAYEIDEDALAMDLDAIGEELELDLDSESVDDDDEPDLEFDDQEVMKFTIEDTQPRPAAGFDTGETSLSVVKNSRTDTLADSSGKNVDGSILYFPENNKEDRAINEFESEVKVTLQAIRDQLQHLTERLFRQERETSDLKQSIAELGKKDAVSAQKKNKKPS